MREAGATTPILQLSLPIQAPRLRCTASATLIVSPMSPLGDYFFCGIGGSGPGDAGHRGAADSGCRAAAGCGVGGLPVARAVPCRQVTRAADVVRVLHEHLQPHLPPATLVAYGYDRASDAIVALAEAGGEPGDWVGTTIPLGERVSGWVAATHHSALNSDARLDLDDDKREHSPAAKHAGGAGHVGRFAVRRALALCHRGRGVQREASTSAAVGRGGAHFCVRAGEPSVPKPHTCAFP